MRPQARSGAFRGMRLVPGTDVAAAGEPRGDLTLLCLRLAEELHSDGAEHPVAAALAVAARGVSGLEPAAFARHLGWDEATVRATESGLVGFADLPPEVGDLLASTGRIDFLQVADLERCRVSPTLAAAWVQAPFPGMAAAADQSPWASGFLKGG